MERPNINYKLLSLARSLAVCACVRACVRAFVVIRYQLIRVYPALNHCSFGSHIPRLSRSRVKERARGAASERASERENPVLCRGSFGPHIPPAEKQASSFLSTPIFSSLLFSLVSFSFFYSAGRRS